MDDHHQIQLEIPNFLYSSAPTLVPGGGAEIVPADWFVNNSYSGPTYNTYQHQQQREEDENLSSSAPFEFADSGPLSFPVEQAPLQPDLSLLTSLAAPSSMGLPIYSASGFDLLSIFSRIANRPNPRVVLGPVDLTCSFVVVDVRRFDHPIVYCSPTFCTLTGYSENEVLHRNCRFLQAPNGQVQKGQPRPFTTESAVAHLRKSLMADKECQTSIVNYKKNGAAFVNLVTVIPVPGEDNEIAYHVGFQVDLGEQPNAILEKLRDGSYIINYTAQSQNISNKSGNSARPSLAIQNHEQHSINLNSRDRKANSIPSITLSKELKRLLADPEFLRSFSIPAGLPGASSVAGNESTSGSAGSHSNNPSNNSNHILHLFLLEAAPDFIHVVSLKGSFLYVAPSVRRVLGYEADEMIGKSLLDYAHPDDVVPLMRELKESSSTGVGVGTGGVPAVSASSAAAGTSSTTGRAASITPTPPPPAAPPPSMPNGTNNNGGMLLPRPVDLLFRIKTKMGRFVWVECRGRLHVEPGKGRKAIILTGRAREMMNLKWEDVKRAGGLAKPKRTSSSPSPSSSSSKNTAEVEQEVWGMLGGNGKETATFLSVGHGVKDVIGWKAEDLIGTALADILHGENTKKVIGGYVQTMRQYQLNRRLSVFMREKVSVDAAAKFMKLRCSMRRKDGSIVDVWFVLYRADPDESSGREEEMDMDDKTHVVHDEKEVGMSISPAPLVYQIRLVDAETVACGPDPGLSSRLNMVAPATTATSLGATALSPLSSMFSPAGAISSSLDSALQEEQALPSYDVFDELSVRRQTSWQYELQHLANTNANLEKQIQELEKAEAAVLQAKSGVPSILQGLTGLSSSSGYEATQVPSAGYKENTLVDVLRMHQQQSQQQQQQQLFSRQPLSLPSYHALLDPPSGSVNANTGTEGKPNLNLLSHSDSSPPHHASSSSTYLHHPQPKFSVQHTIATRERVGVISDETPPPLQSAVHRHGYHESGGPMHQRQHQHQHQQYESHRQHQQYHEVEHPHHHQQQQSRHGYNRLLQGSTTHTNTNTWGTVPIPPLDVALPLCSSPPPPGPASGSGSLKRSWAAVD